MRPYPSSFFILLSNIYCSPTRGYPMFQFPTLTILLPGDIVPVSNRQRWRRSRKIRPERDAEAGSVLRAFAAGTTPEPLANAECRMQDAEWISTLPRVLFGRKLCRARPLQRSQATACFVAVSRVEPWDVLDYLRLTPDTLRGEAFCFAPKIKSLPLDGGGGPKGRRGCPPSVTLRVTAPPPGGS